jgi:endonuclease/exonuclease/phosphatase family metal-dependent hydrolase
VRICTWARLRERSSARAFYVYNVHLDHESQPSREKSAALLGQRLLARDHREEPAIVTGDFNAGEQNAALTAIKAPVLTEYLKPDGTRERPIRLLDTFRVVHPDDRDAGTFNNFGRPGGSTEKIDYILVERGVKTIDAGIDRRSRDGHFPSDHFAVWAKIELPMPASAPTPPVRPPRVP